MDDSPKREIISHEEARYMQYAKNIKTNELIQTNKLFLLIIALITSVLFPPLKKNISVNASEEEDIVAP